MKKDSLTLLLMIQQLLSNIWMIDVTFWSSSFMMFPALTLSSPVSSRMNCGRASTPLFQVRSTLNLLMLWQWQVCERCCRCQGDVYLSNTWRFLQLVRVTWLSPERREDMKTWTSVSVVLTLLWSPCRRPEESGRDRIRKSPEPETARVKLDDQTQVTWPEEFCTCNKLIINVIDYETLWTQLSLMWRLIRLQVCPGSLTAGWG